MVTDRTVNFASVGKLAIDSWMNEFDCVTRKLYKISHWVRVGVQVVVCQNMMEERN